MTSTDASLQPCASDVSSSVSSPCWSISVNSCHHCRHGLRVWVRLGHARHVWGRDRIGREVWWHDLRHLRRTEGEKLCSKVYPYRGSEFVAMKIELRLTHYFRGAFSIFKMNLPQKLPYNETPCIKIHSYLYGACSEFACTNRYLKKFITNSDVTETQSSYKMLAR